MENEYLLATLEEDDPPVCKCGKPATVYRDGIFLTGSQYGYMCERRCNDPIWRSTRREALTAFILHNIPINTVTRWDAVWAVLDDDIERLPVNVQHRAREVAREEVMELCLEMERLRRKSRERFTPA